MALYRIAGLLVEMEASGRTARQAAAYAFSGEAGEPDLTVRCGPARVLAANPWLESLDDAQYMGAGADFERRLPDFGGLRLHASAVLYGGRAWLFSGPCGIGKSTLAGRWERLFGAVALNDDKPVLRRTEGRWRAFGTPWSGKEDRSAPLEAPPGGICFLKRGEENAVSRLSAQEALPLLLSQTTLGLDARRTESLLSLCDLLLREIPFWQLRCTDSDEAALAAFTALCGGVGA